MIALKQVTKQYGQATVLKNITLSIDEPGIYCLLGRNGAGGNNASQVGCRVSEHYKRHDTS